MPDHPPWPVGPPGRPPRLIGHRGAAAHAPENTLAGLRQAREFSLDWVEIDARLTADNVPVVIHDGSLDRTTDRSGSVRGQTAASVRRANAAFRAGAAARHEPVPTLEEALDAAARLGLAVNVELKPEPGEAADTGDRLGRVLSRREDVTLLVSCFDRDCLAAAAAAAPALARALNVERPSATDLGWAVAQGCAAIHMHWPAVDEAVVRAIHAEGLKSGAFTVNAAEDARGLFTLGLDYVFTDDPPALAAVAAEFN